MSYCQYVRKRDINPLHKHYHDNVYGFPIDSDNELFGRLILEINQAGLNWLTILKKQDSFRKSYSYFNVKEVAKFTEKDREGLLSNGGIIRNKLKIDAVIYNANVILKIQEEFGSFKAWLDYYHPLELTDWVKLFKKRFKFIGREICNEFLISCGYLPGAHEEHCPIYEEILKHKPAWKKENG